MSDISVFRNWAGEPTVLGTLRVARASRGERIEFAFADSALADEAVTRVELDPRIRFFAGLQFPGPDRTTFGTFADASPERWGRMLIARRFERDERAKHISPNARLGECARRRCGAAVRSFTGAASGESHDRG